MASMFDRAFEMGLLNPSRWAFLRRHSSKSTSYEPTLAWGTFLKFKTVCFFCFFSLRIHMGTCLHWHKYRCQHVRHVYVNHQPPGRAAASTPAHFDFSPRDRWVQHLRSKWIGIHFLPPDPFADHPRAQHWVIASQILKDKQKTTWKIVQDFKKVIFFQNFEEKIDLFPFSFAFGTHIYNHARYKKQKHVRSCFTKFSLVATAIVSAWQEQVFSIHFQLCPTEKKEYLRAESQGRWTCAAAGRI